MLAFGIGLSKINVAVSTLGFLISHDFSIKEIHGISIGGRNHVTKGWLTDQSEIHIRIHGNPIRMWKPKYRKQTYRIKCTPLDQRYKDVRWIIFFSNMRATFQQIFECFYILTMFRYLAFPSRLFSNRFFFYIFVNIIMIFHIQQT